LIESLDDLEPAALPMPTRCGVGTGRHARPATFSSGIEVAA